MYRDADDAVASYENHAYWKNGPRFQSHGEAAGRARQIPAAEAVPGASLQPCAAAASLVAMYGPSRAAAHAEALKAQQAPHSQAAVFYDQVLRSIERGIVTAKTQGGDQ